jgi:hypothetical protein
MNTYSDSFLGLEPLSPPIIMMLFNFTAPVKLQHLDVEKMKPRDTYGMYMMSSSSSSLSRYYS